MDERDPVRGDGVTHYERLLREVAPLMAEYERAEIVDVTAESIFARYRERPHVAAPDANEAVREVLRELRSLREQVATFRAAHAFAAGVSGEVS